MKQAGCGAALRLTITACSGNRSQKVHLSANVKKQRRSHFKMDKRRANEAHVGKPITLEPTTHSSLPRIPQDLFLTLSPLPPLIPSLLRLVCNYTCAPVIGGDSWWLGRGGEPLNSNRTPSCRPSPPPIGGPGRTSRFSATTHRFTSRGVKTVPPQLWSTLDVVRLNADWRRTLKFQRALPALTSHSLALKIPKLIRNTLTILL